MRNRSKHQKLSHSTRKNERTQFIVTTFTQYFRNEIKNNPKAFQKRFQKMSNSPFQFYRGSAILFYQDMKAERDRWIENNPAAANIFIHGDLHAENFGTYLDHEGVLNFHVNDFDESYIGPFTWDLKRLLASLNLIAYAKGFNDEEIQQVLRVCAENYLSQVYNFAEGGKENFSLTLRNTSGKIKDLLLSTRAKSHVENLNKLTVIQNNNRYLKRSKEVKDVDERTKEQLIQAFDKYLQTIPKNKREEQFHLRHRHRLLYKVKDIVSRSSPGIGSAGRMSYNFLIEGKSETLDDDVVLFMKEATESVISKFVRNPNLETYFQHNGMRTVLASYAMQSCTSKWLGYTTLGNVEFLVDEVSAHSVSLDWVDINKLSQILKVAHFLGRATAKIHCVVDSESVSDIQGADLASLPFSIIPLHTEQTILGAIMNQNEEFINDMVRFGMVYGAQARRDHQLFFEALRNNLIQGLK
ncbi:unnamed protein product [Didymodactylos carnosus]|uniref:DUF2252 domain-containing protein n=1 Tax=Didymodactylos carnosus TaxID=1234261 RepID=A0A815BNI0_9BILA|nr:unnamed protein product [Didymodactylos carnosus]CAF1272745.1 unnamed protein product [Didymodactylos carnosus]CAF3894986.1 unnamed protein product [Didymodactylos carnosus]CAF4062181.1 unnamed protein product [Didymodactylos carnosus]